MFMLWWRVIQDLEHSVEGMMLMTNLYGFEIRRLILKQETGIQFKGRV